MWITTVNKPACPQYCYHQYLWSYFPDLYGQEGIDRPFLFRVLENSILMLSRHKPAVSSSANIEDRIQAGSVYQFDVLASARNGHNTKDGKYRSRFLKSDEIRGWFSRRIAGADAGFVQVFDRPKLKFKKPGGTAIIRPQCVIRGTVNVKDRDEFIETLYKGIGGGGVWGFGLLVMPEVMA